MLDSSWYEANPAWILRDQPESSFTRSSYHSSEGWLDKSKHGRHNSANKACYYAQPARVGNAIPFPLLRRPPRGRFAPRSVASSFKSHRPRQVYLSNPRHLLGKARRPAGLWDWSQLSVRVQILNVSGALISSERPTIDHMTITRFSAGRMAPTLALLVLSPVIVELLFGSTHLTTIIALIPEIGFYSVRVKAFLDSPV